MKLMMIGEGGHSRVLSDIADLSKQIDVVGFFDDKYSRLQKENDYLVGPLSRIAITDSRYPELKWIIAVGNNKIRKKIAEMLHFEPKKYTRLIHPTATISRSAVIGEGTVVMAHAVIQAGAKIGRHAIINTGAIVEHDSQVGDYAHISPNATLTGGVQIGEGAHIGSSATIIPNKTIGEWSIIGAGSTVIHSIPSYVTAFGTPAVLKRSDDHVRSR